MVTVLRNCVKYMTIALPVSGFGLNFTNFHPNFRFISPIKTISLLTIQNKNLHIKCSYQTVLYLTKKSSLCQQTSFRNFSTSSSLQAFKRSKNDRSHLLANAVPRGEGNEGEDSSSLDLAMDSIRGFGDIFPDETTSNLLFDGIKFTDLPIIHIKVSRNNTIMDVSDAKGLTLFKRSCGVEGFKNAKKGTNIAAQATAVTFGAKVLEQGMKNVRVQNKRIRTWKNCSYERSNYGRFKCCKHF